MFVFVFPSASVPTFPHLHSSPFVLPFCFHHPDLRARHPDVEPHQPDAHPHLYLFVFIPNRRTPALAPLRFSQNTHAPIKAWDSQGKDSVAWWSTLVVKPAGSNTTSPLSFLHAVCIYIYILFSTELILKPWFTAVIYSYFDNFTWKRYARDIFRPKLYRSGTSGK